MKSKNLGIILIVFATIFWAISANIGSYLFINKEITPGHITMFRLLISGILLLIFSYIKDKNGFLKVFENKKDSILIFYYAIIGLLFMQYGYFVSIQHSNAATAITIQNIGPLIVIIIMSIFNKKRPDLRIIISLALAFIGGFIIITHGNINQLVISPLALLYGLIAAVGFANYTIVPKIMSPSISSNYLTGWAMLIAGIFFTIVFRPFQESFIKDSITFLGIFYISVFGTLLPFLFFTIGTRLIGPERAGILTQIEPVASTIIAVNFLGVKFIYLDFIGIGLVIFALILISLPKRKTLTNDI